MNDTTRIFGGLIAAALTTLGAAILIFVTDSALPVPAEAADVPAPAQIVSTDSHGRPLLLARVVVSATVLPR